MSLPRKQNAGFNFLDGLFKYLLKIITDEDFLREARGASPSSFTRKRKLSVKDLVLLLLGFSRAGVRHELDRLLKKQSFHSTNIQTYSTSAFTQYRQKLHINSLTYLLKKLLEYFRQHALHQKLYHGYRLVAIDGSTLNLPEEELLRTCFGSSKNQSGTDSTTARISVAYDVLNKLVLDAQISHMKTGECTLAKAHLPQLVPGRDLLIFDRGYPSISFAHFLHKQGFKFCFRIGIAWKGAHKLVKKADDVQWKLPKGTRYWEGGKQLSLKEPIEGFRVVKIHLPNGQYVVLLTNLSDKEAFPKELINEIYRLRWGVEEFYKRIKNVAQVEFFSGKTPLSIEQDFFSRIIMLNISAMIETQELQPAIDDAYISGHSRQANRTQIMLKLKEFAYDLFWNSEHDNALNKMLTLLYQCHSIIRTNRHFKRNRGFRYKRKPLNYKA